MPKKSSIWLIAVIAIVAVAFIVSGCTKKQVVKKRQPRLLPRPLPK
ncbi:MAG: hypothetical protein NTY64_09250 [Deltaproteobacteria bacterium]|nr:hypothetical protein [Deltaproteobacteria bacterium]